MHLRLLSLIVALSAASPVLGVEARTYQGTIGKLPIILEITDPLPNGRREGRYSYKNKGIDIPLHAPAGAKSGIALEEEAPCTPKTCSGPGGEGAERKPAPIAADWALKGDEKRLTGTWTDRKSGKSLPVSLDFVDSRAVSDDIGPDMTLLVDYLNFGESAEQYPYDYLKLKGPYRKGTPQEFNGSTFRIDEDERIGAGYPVIESLSSGSPEAANAWLISQRMAMVLRDYACAATDYQGFGWNEFVQDIGRPYRSEQSGRLEYLSDRLVGVTEAGSFFCGGAHPDNTVYYKLGDVKTGRSIVPESLVKGFVFRDYDGKEMKPEEVTDERPGRYVADPDLIDRIKKDRIVDENEDEGGCEMDMLIEQYLSVAFKGHNLVYQLKDIPNYAAACANDLLVVPLDKARDELTEEGQSYILELDR